MAELSKQGRSGEANLLMLNNLHHYSPEFIRAYIKRYNQ